MRWFPVAFLTNGVLRVTQGGIEHLCCGSACLTTTPRHHDRWNERCLFQESVEGIAEDAESADGGINDWKRLNLFFEFG